MTSAWLMELPIYDPRTLDWRAWDQAASSTCLSKRRAQHGNAGPVTRAGYAHIPLAGAVLTRDATMSAMNARASATAPQAKISA